MDNAERFAWAEVETELIRRFGHTKGIRIADMAIRRHRVNMDISVARAIEHYRRQRQEA
jgi:hypothetical protein